MLGSSRWLITGRGEEAARETNGPRLFLGGMSGKWHSYRARAADNCISGCSEVRRRSHAAKPINHKTINLRQIPLGEA